MSARVTRLFPQTPAREELIAEIRAAGDGMEVADILAGRMLSAIMRAPIRNREEAAHNFAINLLPLVRPDLFADSNKGGRK